MRSPWMSLVLYNFMAVKLQGAIKLTPAQAEQMCWLIRKFLRADKEILVQGNPDYSYVALYEVMERKERVIVFEGGETQWLPIHR